MVATCHQNSAQREQTLPKYLLSMMLILACTPDSSVNKITDGTEAGTDAETDTGTDPAPEDTSRPINTPPEVTVTLTPNEAYTNDVVTAEPSATDADGDEIALNFVFMVDGAVVQDGTDARLDGSVHFDKGQVITVTVTADDGTDSSSATSDAITVLNTPPTAPVVSLADPFGSTTYSGELHCIVEVESTDADLDPITYSFTWDADGATHTAPVLSLIHI